jgi:hypothetical protein
MLSNWSVLSGSFVSVQDNSFEPASTSATYRMFISYGSGNVAEAPSLANVSAFVGANVNIGGTALDAGGAVEGSATSQTFSGHAGDVVTFSYDFLTGAEAELSLYPPADLAVVEGSGAKFADDYAFVAITHGGVTNVIRLADMLSPGYQDASALTNYVYSYDTGFQTFSLTLPAGLNLADTSYTISFGVMDGGTPAQPVHGEESALLLESLDLNSPQAVPLPSSCVAGAVLFSALAVYRRGKRLHKYL